MAEAPTVYFNPWDPAFRANPYPHYEALREGPPRVIPAGPVTIALVARYADVQSVLRDHDRFSSKGPPPPPEQYQGKLAGSRNLLGTDPPDHSRLRRIVSRDFTPRRIREMEPRIREIAREILDRAERAGEFDVVKDLANVMPVTVIAEMLGVPAEMNATFKEWSDKLIDAGNNLPGTPQSPEVVKTIDALCDFFDVQIEARRREPHHDLVSALVAAHDEGDKLSGADLLSFLTVLLIAGNETTTNLIANGTNLLIRNPAELAKLRANLESIPGAIEEMLRFDPPVQATARFPQSAVDIGGVEIPAGTIALVIVAAANRDPAQFPHPESFDVARSPNEHLSFGEGIHFCLGAPLARLEAKVAFSEMLGRFPRMRPRNPEAPAVYRGSYFLRGVGSLPMELE